MYDIKLDSLSPKELKDCEFILHKVLTKTVQGETFLAPDGNSEERKIFNYSLKVLTGVAKRVLNGDSADMNSNEKNCYNYVIMYIHKYI